IEPDGVLDIGDGLNERDETKIGLDETEQRRCPASPTRADNPEFAATLSAEMGHELAKLDDALAKRFRIADEVGRDGELAIKKATRSARIVKGQMGKDGIPSMGVEPFRGTHVTEIIGAHQGVE